MPDANVLPDATTTDGALLVLAIVLPAAGVLLSFVLGGRYAERIASVLLPSGFVLATIIFVDVWRSGHRLIYIVGDWKPPLGIALRADGLSAAMMVAMAIVICAVAIFAHADFGTRAGSVEARAPFAFWILLMAIWGAMNLIFLGGDLFTLYVALELLTFAAVPLVCLDGRAETLQAALRYLLFALLGSILYLVGTALLYGSYATLDIVLLLPPGSYGTRDTCCRHADDHRDSSPRPPSFPCIYGFRQPMPVRRRPPARFCRRWW